MTSAPAAGPGARLSAALPPAARLAGWLALLLLLAKAIYLRRERPGVTAPLDFLWHLAAIGHADVLFAAAFGAAALALLALAQGRPRAERGTLAGLVLFGALSAGFGVANLEVFAYLRAPVTRTLLYLAGSPGTIRSSIGSFLTPLVAAGLLGFPLAYAALVLHRPRAPLGRRAAPAVAALAALFVGYGAHGYDTGYYKREDWKIALSPHAALLGSYAAAALGEGTATISAGDHRPEDLADFAPVSERPRPAPHAIGRPGAPRPKNVVLLVLESTGTKYLSLYGSRWDATPCLAREAAHALVFDAAYCQVGRSANSLVALVLSAYPRITWRDTTEAHTRMPGTSLAGELRRRGARTYLATSGDFDWAGMRVFLDGRGFERIEEKGEVGGEMLTSWSVEDRFAIDAMIRAIERADARGEPFFVMGWTVQAHHPYEPTPGAPLIDFFRGGPLPRDAWDLGRYLNVLRETDRHLGRLFDGLRARGLDRDTLVVVTGDHGEAFGDPHETWGHGGGLFQEDVRVPLLLWYPPLFEGAGRTDRVVQHVDLAPTICDILGIEPAPDWQGRSVFEDGRPPRAYFFSMRYDYLLGVREERWKYIFNATLGDEDLFDLAADPEERRDVHAEEPALCRRLRERLAAWIEADRRRYSGAPAARAP